MLTLKRLIKYNLAILNKAVVKITGVVCRNHKKLYDTCSKTNTASYLVLNIEVAYIALV